MSDSIPTAGASSSLFARGRSIACGLLFVLGTVLLGGCASTSALEEVTAGKTSAYQPGVPNFDMETVPTRRNGENGVDLHLGVPFTSLVYEEDSTDFSAKYEFLVQLRSADRSEVLAEQMWTDTVRVADYEKTESFQSMAFTRRLEIEPGTYVFRVVLLDLTSGRRAVRRQRVTVPDLVAQTPVLTPLHLESRQDGETFEPLVALHTPSDLDSLRAMAELYNAPAADRTEIQFELVRFRSDQSAGDPPDGITPLMSSLEYQGVDYGVMDTIRTSSYALGNPGDPSVITFDLTDLQPGIYRAVVEAHMHYDYEADGDSTQVLRSERTVSVKAPDFPRITTLDEMISALTYIATDDELEEMRRPQSPEERRKEFDEFWGTRAGNEQQASQLIEAYYGRIEEANRFFTSQKAGWKTDRGMIYIVMGPPIEVDHYVDTEIWRYEYGGRDPADTFVFERGRNADRRGPMFNNYILQREPYYRRDWQTAVHDWREGEAPRGGV